MFEYYLGESILGHRIIKKLIMQLNKYFKKQSCFIVANESDYKYYSSNDDLTIYTSMSRAIEKFIDDENNVGNEMLFVISSKQTSRGSSIRNVSKNPEYTINNITYANCAIFCCSDTLATDQIKQQAHRIGGNFPGHQDSKDFRLTLYTTDRIETILNNQLQDDQNNFKLIEENPNSFLTELINPTEEQRHKVVSVSRGKVYQKKMDGMYYHTIDTIEKKKKEEEALIKEYELKSEKTLNSQILEVLGQFGGLTAIEIYCKKKDWLSISNTPDKSISTACLLMVRKGILNKTEQKPYLYSIRD